MRQDDCLAIRALQFKHGELEEYLIVKQVRALKLMGSILEPSLLQTKIQFDVQAWLAEVKVDLPGFVQLSGCGNTRLGSLNDAVLWTLRKAGRWTEEEIASQAQNISLSSKNMYRNKGLTLASLLSGDQCPLLEAPAPRRRRMM